MTSVYALADELIAAEARRDATARELEDANRRAMALLGELEAASLEVARLRERLGREVGVR